MVDDICQRISAGESLRQICATKGFPSRETVFNWLEAYPDFLAKYARARERQGDAMDDKILEAGELVLAGELDPHAAKVAIGAFQWRASKLRPKVYGDAATLKHADPDGNAMVFRVEDARVPK